MKKLIAIATLTILFGCEYPKSAKIRTEKLDDSYSVIEIDGCEYLQFEEGVLDQRVYSFTHKGNCKFCQQRKDTLNLSVGR